jgi:hypothetical protein
MFERTFAILLVYYKRRRRYKHFVPNGTNRQRAKGRTHFRASYFFFSVIRTGSPSCSNGISSSWV